MRTSMVVLGLIHIALWIFGILFYPWIALPLLGLFIFTSNKVIPFNSMRK